MATLWFVQIMGEEIGPLSSDQLKEMVGKGRLSTDDKVRKGSSGDWVSAIQVRGLFDVADDLRAQATPPTNSSLILCPDCSNKISINASSCPNCGRPMRTKQLSSLQITKSSSPAKSRHWIAWTAAAFIALTFIGVFAGFSSGGRSGSRISNATRVANSPEFQAKLDDVNGKGKAIMNLLELGTTRGQIDEQLKNLRLTVAELMPKTPNEMAQRAIAQKLLETLDLYVGEVANRATFERTAGKFTRTNNPDLYKKWREEADKNDGQRLAEIRDLFKKLEPTEQE